MRRIALTTATCLCLLASSISLKAQTTTITFHGGLTGPNSTFTGSAQLRFRLYGSLSGADQIGQMITIDNVNVINGVFRVELNFGPNAFPGADRFMEIDIKKSNGNGFTTLTPRQPINSAPYAIRALTAASADSFSGSCLLCITDAQIASISGSKVIGPVANANASVTAAKLAPGTIPSSTSLYDPQLLGMLRWDLLPTGATIQVGELPQALAFDGTFIYVANTGSSSVSRIRASTCAVEGSPISVGVDPVALAFDGTFVYVVNGGSDSVSRIRVSTGAVEGSPGPSALAFDGTFIYVANTGSNSVSRIRASTGAVEGNPIPVGLGPSALAFDGAFVYVANSVSNTVTRFRP
jgi:YVTN family beta-propeller protein